MIRQNHKKNNYFGNSVLLILIIRKAKPELNNYLKQKVMNKLLSITNAIVVNVVLLAVIQATFNPLNLPLLELKYFSGFNLENLFSPDPVTNILLIFSVIGLITFIINLIKNRKN